MGIPDMRAFIEQQTDSFHDYRSLLNCYRAQIYGVYKMIYTAKFHANKTEPRITVSLFSNFRDTFWHFRELISPSVTHPDIQYALMRDHINWAAIDALVELLQKLYRIHRIIAILHNHINTHLLMTRLSSII